MATLIKERFWLSLFIRGGHTDKKLSSLTIISRAYITIFQSAVKSVSKINGDCFQLKELINICFYHSFDSERKAFILKSFDWIKKVNGLVECTQV